VNTRRGFDLRSASLTLVSVALKTLDLDLLSRELDELAADSPGLFDCEPVVLDLSAVRELADELPAAALLALLRGHELLPVAARGGNAAQMAALQALGLNEAEGGGRAAAAPVNKPAAPVQETPAAAEPAPAPEPPPPLPVATRVIDKPLRSGQQVYARGGDLVVLAAVSFGAEVIADGSIHVYAPLRGRAVAGARGDTSARIYSTCMEPQLISIAGTYLTTDTPLAADVHGKPACAWLDEGRLRIEPLEA
jgi:septum site-determining protein MinC